MRKLLRKVRDANWWWQRDPWPHSSEADLEPWWFLPGVALAIGLAGGALMWAVSR